FSQSTRFNLKHADLNAAPEIRVSVPFSDASEVSDALFWDRRRPRLQNVTTHDFLAVRGQARTPAVPEERARYFIGVTEGYGNHNLGSRV
ncbi:MAG TPA: hypothetical protein VIK24_19545, partial [Pyrinomonadaceae bacterium]